MVEDRVRRVLPTLVDQPAPRRSLVLHVAVAVPVAELVDPGHRPIGVREQSIDHLGGESPATELTEQHHEQRRGVDRAERPLAGEREGRRRPEAQPVKDLPGLLLGSGVHLTALEARQRLQHAERDVGIDQQRHPPRQQRVAAVQVHRPRRAGGHDHRLGSLGVEDPQRPEVLDALGDRRRERRMVGVDVGSAPAPLGETLGRGHALDRLAAAVARHERDAAHERRDLQADLPGPPGGDQRLEARASGFERREWPADLHPDPSPVGTAPLLGDQSAVPVGSRVARGTGDLTVPDQQQIGEVALHLDLEVAVDRFVGEVVHLDVLAQALPHEASPHHHQRWTGLCAIGLDGDRVDAPDERGGERLVDRRRQRLRFPAVHPESESGQQPRPPVEEAVAVARDDVARPRRSDDRDPLDERARAIRRSGAPHVGRA